MLAHLTSSVLKKRGTAGTERPTLAHTVNGKLHHAEKPEFYPKDSKGVGNKALLDRIWILGNPGFEKVVVCLV